MYCRQRQLAGVVPELVIGTRLLLRRQRVRLPLQLHRRFENVAPVLIVRLRVVEHEVEVAQHVFDALVLLPLGLLLDKVERDRTRDNLVVVRQLLFVGQLLERQDQRIAVLVLEPPESPQQRLDARLGRREDPGRPAPPLCAIGVPLRPSPAASPASTTSAAVVVRIVVVVLFVFLFFLFLFVFLVFVVFGFRRLVRWGELAQVRQLGLFGLDDALGYQLLKLFHEDLAQPHSGAEDGRRRAIVYLGVVADEGYVSHEFGELSILFLLQFELSCGKDKVSLRVGTFRVQVEEK